MTVTYDLYKALDLDRSWDEKTIKSKLKEKQKFWTLRQSACNDKEQLLLIDEIMSYIEDGYRFLIKAIKRKLYDEALDNAYKKGLIKDEVEEKMKDLLDQAMAYYRKGNVKLAAQCAQEAVDGNINDPKAYDILARCYYDMKSYQQAIETIDAGVNIYKDDLNLHWLGARIAIVGTQNYDDAQDRVDKLIEVAPNNSVGRAEQIFLYLNKGYETDAFNEIDSYISSHPSDENFKKNVAYDLDTYSKSCYYYDAKYDTSFIADKEAYEKCLRLRSKAAEIYSDEYTEKQLDNAKYYGKKEWNSWNSESIKSLTIYGLLLLLMYWPVGIILLIIDIILVYYSFRPYWQINKTYVTGEMGTAERLASKIGDIAGCFGGWLVRAIWKFMIMLFRFIWWIIFRNPFA